MQILLESNKTPEFISFLFNIIKIMNKVEDSTTKLLTESTL